VLKENVHEHDEMAATRPLLIYYVKMNSCILQIRLWQNERQQSVNKFWTCKSVNSNVIWSLLCISNVLAAFMGRIAKDIVTALF